MAIADWLKFAGDAGSAAANMSAGRASGRLAEAEYGLQRDRLGLDRYTNASRNAIRGGLLKGLQDTTISGLPPDITVPKITGGVRPSAVVGREQIGDQMQRDAMLQMMQGTSGGSDGGGPQAGKLDGFLNTFGTVAPLLGKIPGLAAAGAGLGAGTSTAAGLLSATGAIPGVGIPTSAITGVGGAAAGGGGIGGTIAGLASNPVTIAAAAALAIGLAIKKHQNATKGDRNKFARDAGFKDIGTFNEYLSTLGPAGQAARTYGENVVGKHNKQQEAQWMQMVQQAVNASGKPLTMGQAPTLASRFGGR